MKCGRLDLTSFDLSHRQSNYGRLRAGVASTRPRYLGLLTRFCSGTACGNNSSRVQRLREGLEGRTRRGRARLSGSHCSTRCHRQCRGRKPSSRPGDVQPAQCSEVRGDGEFFHLTSKADVIQLFLRDPGNGNGSAPTSEVSMSECSQAHSVSDRPYLVCVCNKTEQSNLNSDPSQK